MTGILRFVGVANAAVWLGGALFHLLAVAPALVSHDMLTVLRPDSFPYYSSAIGHVLLARYFWWDVACATVALLHLWAERLYLGRTAQGFWTGLLVGLFGLSLIGAFWLTPKLRALHRAQYVLKETAPGQRQAAAKSLPLWQGCLQGLNVLMIAGVAIYFWRAAHPPDELRFVGSSKIRG